MMPTAADSALPADPDSTAPVTLMGATAQYPAI